MSKLNFGPEWYLNLVETTSQCNELCPTTESGTISSVEHSVIQPELVVNEYNRSSYKPAEDILLANKSLSMLAEDHQIPLNVPTILSQSEPSTSPVGQYPYNLCPATENKSGPVSHVDNSVIQPDLVVNKSSTSSSQLVVDVLSANEFLSMLTEDQHIPINVPTLPPALLLQSESLPLPIGQFPVESMCPATENEFSLQLPRHCTSSNRPEHSSSLNQLKHSTSSNQPESTSSSQPQNILSEWEQYNENKVSNHPSITESLTSCNGCM